MLIENRNDLIAVLTHAKDGDRVDLHGAVARAPGARAIVRPASGAGKFLRDEASKKDNLDDLSRSGPAPGQGGE